MHGTASPVYGEPEEWGFDYPFDEVQTGFWLWQMSGFKYLPTQDEVRAYDKRWLSDMRLAQTIYGHQGNNSPLMQMLEESQAQAANAEHGENEHGIARMAGRKNPLPFDDDDD